MILFVGGGSISCDFYSSCPVIQAIGPKRMRFCADGMILHLLFLLLTVDGGLTGLLVSLSECPSLPRYLGCFTPKWWYIIEIMNIFSSTVLFWPCWRKFKLILLLGWISHRETVQCIIKYIIAFRVWNMSGAMSAPHILYCEFQLTRFIINSYCFRTG